MSVSLLAWAQSLGDAIKFQSVSWNETDQNEEELEGLQDFLKERFKGVFMSPWVEVFTVNRLSLLLRVSGSHHTRNPYLLAGHLDVVPTGEPGRWDRDPFLGQIVEEPGGEQAGLEFC